MKLVRAFIAFVVVSLVLGVGSAFNGQNYNSVEEIDSPVEIVETENIPEDESTEIVETDELEEIKEETINNSFSASKKETTISKQTTESPKQKTPSTTTSSNTVQNNSKTDSSSSNTQQPSEREDTTIVEVQYTDHSNDFLYSITHGITEYDTESECKVKGEKIKHNELNSLLDWNEEHPEDFKKPVIKSYMCLIVVENNKEYWFLHFITIDDSNRDIELKELYR